MWIGKVPISRRKVEKIAELAGMSLKDILEHRVSKQQNLEIADWTISYKAFIRRLKKETNK
jgi:hypothetical protein